MPSNTNLVKEALDQVAHKRAQICVRLSPAILGLVAGACTVLDAAPAVAG